MVGMEADVEVDVYTVPVPTVIGATICSDGLTDMVRERDIERIARSAADLQRAAEDLVDAANMLVASTTSPSSCWTRA